MLKKYKPPSKKGAILPPMIPYKHLFLADIFSDCQEKFANDKPVFLSLLETHIDIDEIIPISFRNHFYASAGNPRKYPLQAFLCALIIQRIFSIPTDQLLLAFLAYSKPLREFCGFTKVLDASEITRFKQDFLDNLQLVFDQLVDITDPICQAIDSAKADMTIFDSSGNEAFVIKNNPKYAHQIIRQLKAYAKAQGFDKSYAPYNTAYASMPSHASANPEIKQLYINGHFCYVFKFGIVPNGLGIIRHISFYNNDFMPSHPDIVGEKKSNSPDKDKCVRDSKLLIPTLKDFISRHPLINPKTFLGDTAFDTVEPYKNLRAYPGTIRETDEWNSTYKLRTVVERDINHIKDNLCLAGRRTQNEKTLHANLILAGITQLITVVLADKIKHHGYIRSSKPLIA